MSRHTKSALIRALLTTVILAAAFLVTRIPVGDIPLSTRIDALYQDFLFQIRNKFFEQSISDEIALIGIDDATIRVFGRFGAMRWKTRKPFLDQAILFREVFQPSEAVYDILFKEDKGENDKDIEELMADRTWLGTLHDAGGAIGTFLPDGSPDMPTSELLAMSQFLSFQGNVNFANELSRLSAESQGATIGTNVILAFYLPDEMENRKKWNTTQILGNDQDDLSEDNGTAVPYLQYSGLPMEVAKNVPEDFEYYRYAAVLPTNVFLDYAQIASINAPRDPDGAVRSYPLIHGIEYEYPDPNDGHTVRRRFFVPSLALQACLSHWGINLQKLNIAEDFNVDGRPVIEIRFGDAIVVRPPGGDREIVIPIDDRGRMLLDFVGNIDKYSAVSFGSTALGDWSKPKTEWDANQQKTHEMLYRKIVFVGITETGAADIGPTPIDDLTPFVLVHMTAANNMLTQTYIRRLQPRGFLWVFLVIWVMLALGASLLSPRFFTLGSVMLVMGYLAVAFFGVVSHRTLLPVTAPVTGIMFSYLGVLFFHYVTEEKAAKQARGMFATNVSPAVLRYLEEHPESYSLGGEKRDATMFFSDLAGFTSISERLTSGELVDLLNQYLTPMSDIIISYDGYVDKYEGDSIMAVWGVPYPNPDHPMQACSAALEQQERLVELRPKFLKDFGAEVYVRMGINSGEVTAGYMGSEQKMSYTVMGDPVNTAARFEPLNKDYATYIAIGESTHDICEQYIEARLLDRVVVVGKTIPLRVYELLGKKGQIPEPVAEARILYEDALTMHNDRRWDEAIEKCRQSLKLREGDLAAENLIKRLHAYKSAPPPEGWRGELVRTTKG